MKKVEDIFLDNLAAIAAGPGGVHRLRELVLELAVHLAATSDSPSIKYVPLGECGEWLGGLTPSKQRAEYWDDDSIPWFSPKDMKRVELDDAQDHVTHRALEETSLKLLPSGSVLFVVRGMILAHTFPVAVTTRPATINQDMRAIIPKAEIADRYLVTVLRGYERKILGLVQTATHGTKRLDSPDLKQWVIPVPPLDKQRRVVEKVDRLMALCDDLERRQQTEREERRRLRTASLKALEDAATVEDTERILTQIFGTFELLFDGLNDIPPLRQLLLQMAFRGKLVPQDGCDEPANELLKKIESQQKNLGNPKYRLNVQKLKTLELPSIPETWVWCHLNSIFDFVTSGSRGWAQYYANEGASFVRIGNLTRSSINLDLKKIQRVLPPDNAETERTKLRKNDILVSITADIGSVGLVSEEIGEAYINQHIALCRPNKNVDPDFVAWYIFSDGGGKRHFSELQRGATKIGLGLDDIKAVNIPLPPLAEQCRIVTEINHYMTLCDTIETGIRARDAALEEFAGAACRAVLDGPAPVAVAVEDGASGQQRLPV